MSSVIIPFPRPSPRPVFVLPPLPSIGARANWIDVLFGVLGQRDKLTREEREFCYGRMRQPWLSPDDRQTLWRIAERVLTQPGRTPNGRGRG